MAGDLSFVVRVLGGDGTGVDDDTESGAPLFLGTGTAVAPDRVLTCRHVILEPDPFGRPTDAPHPKLWVESAEGTRIGVRELAIEPGRDLALLTLEAPVAIDVPPFLCGITHALEPRLRASSLVAFGYTQAGHHAELWHHEVGDLVLLSSYREGAETMTQLQLRGGLPVGSSGGPVVVRCDGRWLYAGTVFLGGERSATSRLIMADAVMEFLAEVGQRRPITIDGVQALAPEVVVAANPPGPDGIVPAKRKLAAILHADVAGYGRLTGDDDVGTHTRWMAHRCELDTVVARHGGRIVGPAGAAVLADFESAVDALAAAVEIQRTLADRNAPLPAPQRLQLRIGIDLGDVIVERDDIFGDGVNVARRLGSLAPAGGIAISAAVREQTEGRLDLALRDQGLHTVENITEPIRVYTVQLRDTDESPLPAAGRRRARRLSLVLLLGVGLVGLGYAAWTYRAPDRLDPDQLASPERMALPLPQEPSIAVLPFANISDDAQQEYFVTGFTDTLITDLSRISGLFVIGRDAVFAYASGPVTTQRVAEDLGVRYVLEGSVQKAGEALRINARLVDAVSGDHLWGGHYDGELHDVFRLQDEVTTGVVGALQVRLTAEEQVAIAKSATTSVTAYDWFLRGLDHLRRLTADDLLAAAAAFERAVGLDPGFGSAHAALAKTYWESAETGDYRRLGLSLPQAARLEAGRHLGLALRHPTPLAHQLASEMHLLARRHDEALAEAERALALNANDPVSHIAMAKALIFAGRPAEAVPHVERAMRLDPRFAVLVSGAAVQISTTPAATYLLTLGLARFVEGDLKRAVTLLERALERDPDDYVAAAPLAAAYAHLGRPADASAALDRLRRGREKALGRATDIAYERQAWPFERSADMARFLDGLHRAGLG